ncbi:hypothetical protein LNQ03_04330 [Klebsiella pneumoniae subsp. pneumoniae]|nr:hypothetical protein [Klebsiella pneumoniae subsp. pneumoniae]
MMDDLLRAKDSSLDHRHCRCASQQAEPLRYLQHTIITLGKDNPYR